MFVYGYALRCYVCICLFMIVQFHRCIGEVIQDLVPQGYETLFVVSLSIELFLRNRAYCPEWTFEVRSSQGLGSLFYLAISGTLCRIEIQGGFDVACVESRLNQVHEFTCQLFNLDKLLCCRSTRIQVTISGLNISQAGQILKLLCFVAGLTFSRWDSGVGKGYRRL